MVKENNINETEEEIKEIEKVEEDIYSVYAKINEEKLVTKIFSTCFEQPDIKDVFIKSGSGDEFVHTGYYLIYTGDGLYRYKLDDNNILVERTDEELQEERNSYSNIINSTEDTNISKEELDNKDKKIEELEKEIINSQQQITDLDLRLISIERKTGGDF